MYEYNLEIHYDIENNVSQKRISFAKERVRRLHDLRNFLIDRLQRANAHQAKYYNEKHQLKSYAIDDLVMLSTKNLKQKRFNKKLSHRFERSFKIENKIEAQTYRLTLFFNYRIHNIFHVFLLESYHHRVDDANVNAFMQASKLIDDDEQ